MCSKSGGMLEDVCPRVLRISPAGVYGILKSSSSSALVLPLELAMRRVEEEQDDDTR